MSRLFARSINLTRFSAEFPDSALRETSAIVEALNRCGFRDIESSADPQSIGWVTAADPAIAEFEDSGLLFVDRFLFFSLRHDVRRVPSAVLRRNIKEAESAWLAEHPGLRRPPKQVREQIRDTHQALLLAKTIPAPSVNDVVWDIDSGDILLLSSSTTVIDRFDSLFRKTFAGVHLRMITPYNYADRAVSGGELANLLQKQNQANSDSVLELMKANRWIGQDFLLWLLSGSAGENSESGVTAWIDSKVVLVGENGEGVEKITVSGAIATTQYPLKAALREGKRITAATICMSCNDDEWRLNLTGETFAIAAFRTPVVEVEEGDQVDERSEAQSARLEKVHLIDKGVELLTALMRYFLGERLVATSWDARLREIDVWMNEDRDS